MTAGARWTTACAALQISERTLRRWRQGMPEGEVHSDRRPEALRLAPVNKLSDEECTEMLSVCNYYELSSLPPSQIVPRLADCGRYIASESSFYRVLCAHGQQHHRGRSRVPRRLNPSTSYQAIGPCQSWTWDITWMLGPITGSFLYLYLILDIFSRKIVGWEVHEVERAELAAGVIQRAVWAEACIARPKVLHADNGAPMKGATMKATLERLGIIASYSRPCVSNDNPFSEALFRTCKYRPAWPRKGFASKTEAQAWGKAFVNWYNAEHLHCALRFVTPNSRHAGEGRQMLAKRADLYAKARASNPQRWSGKARNWQPAGPVWLNPERDSLAGETRDAA